MDKPFTFPKALLRWVILLVIAWLFMFLVPGQWFVNWYLPMSFFLLMGTVTFGVIGLGWPLAVPGGSWKPGRSRWLTGIGMTIIWIAAALLFTAIETWIWPKMPLTGAPTAEGVPGLFGVWFGIGVFTSTLWYAFDGIETRPYGPAKSWANWLLATVTILIMAAMMWFLLTNLDITSGAKEAFNQGGKWFGGDWFALCVWIIVFIQMFGGPMVFQCWPFYRAGKRLHPLLVTFFAVLFGYIAWRFILPAIEPDGATFGWAALGATLIGWSLMSSVAFEFFPFAKYKQPMRGLGIFALWQVVVPILWILLLRYVIGPPLMDHINGAFPAGANPADINLVTAWFTLHNLAIWVLIHNFFFMRAPWSIPGPPLGPEECPMPAKMAK